MKTWKLLVQVISSEKYACSDCGISLLVSWRQFKLPFKKFFIQRRDIVCVSQINSIMLSPFKKNTKEQYCMKTYKCLWPSRNLPVTKLVQIKLPGTVIYNSLYGHTLPFLLDKLPRSGKDRLYGKCTLNFFKVKLLILRELSQRQLQKIIQISCVHSTYFFPNSKSCRTML